MSLFSNNSHNMFNLILLMFAIKSLLFCAQCHARSKFDLPERLDIKLDYDILDERLGKYTKVNLARGTPEIMPPTFLIETLSNVSMSKDRWIHEYMPYEGSEELRKEIALLYSKLIYRSLNMSKNVVVTVGATQAIFLSIHVHTEPGDEWIVLQPAYQDYAIDIKMAGGKVIPVLLKSNSTGGKLSSRDFVFDKDEMTKAFSSRTKGIIVNNPHSPTGKSFTKDELLFIAKLAIKWNTLIFCDEAYEWINYDSTKHIRMASLGEDIFNRTITFGSASKIFFASGFRVGWAYGPPKLIGNMKTLLPYTNFAGNSYAQIAVAAAVKKLRLELENPNSYNKQSIKLLAQKRNFALKLLDSIGMDTIVPENGFFIFMNYTRLASTIPEVAQEPGNTMDWKFLSWLVKKTGVQLYPGTDTYINQLNIGQDYIRLCFAKDDEHLNKAASLLESLKKQ